MRRTSLICRFKVKYLKWSWVYFCVVNWSLLVSSNTHDFPCSVWLSRFPVSGMVSFLLSEGAADCCQGTCATTVPLKLLSHAAHCYGSYGSCVADGEDCRLPPSLGNFHDSFWYLLISHCILMEGIIGLDKIQRRKSYLPNYVFLYETD